MPEKVLIRSLGDSTLWLLRHYRWELTLVVATAFGGAIIGKAADLSAWEIIGLAVASGYLSVALLWLGSFVVHLFLAPGRLRRLEAKPPLERRTATVELVIPPSARETELATRAVALIPSLKRLSHSRWQLLGRGATNEEILRRIHSEVLAEVELFGDLVKAGRGESGTRRERREARLLYEGIKGFHLGADLELFCELIRTYAKPPPESILRKKVLKPIRQWWMRLWIQVS